jgi:hypothetical protein
LLRTSLLKIALGKIKSRYKTAAQAGVAGRPNVTQSFLHHGTIFSVLNNPLSFIGDLYSCKTGDYDCHTSATIS